MVLHHCFRALAACCGIACLASASPASDAELGGGETQVTVVGTDARPAWSPSGSNIAFDSNQGGDRNLWTVTSTGSSRTQLTTNSNADQHPDWSPDGTQIVYVASTGGTTDLWLIPSGGGAPTLLDTDVANDDKFPHWSPDGSTIAYEKNFDIFTIPAAGGTPFQVTTDPANDQHPSWSPDGTQLAFLSGRSGNNDIWVIPAAGGVPIQITTDPSTDGAPEWSPDGTKIAFQSNRTGNNDIWTIPAGGGAATQITTDLGNDAQPDWSPSGAAIAFARVGSGIWIYTFPGPPTPAPVVSPTPGTYVLERGRPNPFRLHTTIPFEVPAAGRAALSIFDASGRLVRTLVRGEIAAGRHAPVWDGRDETGRRVAAGIYFVRLEGQAFDVTRKVVRLR